MLLTQQSGILKPFALILGYILEGIFWVLGKFSEYPSVGIAIIIFTIVVNVLMLPLTMRQQKFSKLSNKMNPEIQAIQEKYKDKKDNDSLMRMQQETQAVYAKYGVSPSGSCVQLLIQMPILFALYRVIYNMPAYVNVIKEKFYIIVDPLSQYAGDEKFTEFLKDLSSYSRYSKQVSNADFLPGTDFAKNTLIDILNSASTGDWLKLKEAYAALSDKIDTAQMALEKFNSFLGLNIANSPSYIVKEQLSGDKNYLVILGVLMIPVLAGATQWINTKLMPQQENNNKKGAEENPMVQSMKTMNTVMPLMSMFFCYSLAVGMGIYWITGSVVRSVIQVIVNKHIDSMDIDEMIKQNVEKNNEKRRKAGLPPQQISQNATVKARNVETKKEKTAEEKAKLAKDVKDSTEYYNKNAEKPGSLASKAAMVKRYNEKNNKN